MTKRHDDWLRFRFNGAGANAFASVGRKVMGQLVEQMRFAGLSVGKATRVLPDGTRIVARHDGATPHVTIETGGNDAPVTSTVEVTTVAWIPRGFVVYPASDDSRSGWGGPPLPAPGVGTWNIENLRPGADVSRWEPGGKLGEVLLTRVRGAGYPSRRRNTVPAFYEAVDVPGGLFIDAFGRALPLGTPTAPRSPTTAWTAYRMEFEDALNRATMEPDVLMRQLFVEIRGDDAFLMPLRGFYDRAWRASSYVRTPDLVDETMVDGELPSAPDGYQFAPERATHDGVMKLEREAITRYNAPIGEIGEVLADAIALRSDFEPAATTLHVADVGALRTLVAEERRQWIAYGARRWYPPAGLGLPVLSWDGTPFTNWPARLVAGYISGGLPIDIETMTGPFHGTTQPLFSKRLYAWGRVIGELPDTVLAAAIQVRASDYRIVVLTFRNTDQPGPVTEWTGQANPIFNMLARVRVWFVDIERGEGLTMLLHHARVGEFDGATNPRGWKYAGMLRMAPDDQLDSPLQFFGAQQAPVFNATGDRVLMAFFRQLRFLGFPVITETVLAALDEGVLETNRTLWGGGGDEHFMSELLIEGVIPFDIYGVDFAPPGSRFPFSVVYEHSNVIDDEGIAETTVVRQNNYTTGASTFEPQDIRIFGRFSQYVVQIYTMDVQRAVILGLNHVASAGGFEMVWVREGSVLQSQVFPDPYGVPQINDVPNQQRQSTSIVQPTYVRRGDDQIFGFEIAPQSGAWPVPPNAFVASRYFSTLGDLAALTQTPGDRPGFYPVGVV